ncbi:MAG: protease pro-enzyme activation domain-containing protein [Conexivisphaerales archaeon]
MKKAATALIIAVALFVSTISTGTLLGVSGATTAPLVAVANTQPKQITGDFGNYTVSPGTYDPNHKLLVTISFFPQHSLGYYLNLVSNPNSPAFHDFLSPSQIAELAGNSAAYQQAVSYFESYGLQTMQSTTELTLAVQGTASQLAAAFHTKIGAFNITYRSKGIYNAVFGNSSTVKGSASTLSFYANTEPIYLPSSIASSISGISGLDGAFASPQLMVLGGSYPTPNIGPNASQLPIPKPATNVTWNTAVNATNGYYGWYNACNVFGTCSGTSPYEQMFFPSTMPRLVQANKMWQQGFTGKGITIAVVEVGCIDPSAIQQFSQQVFGNNSLPNRFTQIAIDQSSLASCVSNGFASGWTIETALDIEYAATMAPDANIVLIGIPSPFFSYFDLAYQTISSYFSPGSTCSLPSYVTAYDGYGNNLTQLPATACPIDITSNSYGAGETYTAYYGSPMYLTVEDQLIESMALEGITNFFAAGDTGSYSISLDSFIPASSPGSVPVGGGSILAANSTGYPFPDTGIYSSIPPLNFTVVLANASMIANYTYWSFGSGLGGTYQGIVGGGFGQSISLPQPWWEMGLDIYNTGQLIIPTISGQADFQMTIDYLGNWYPAYGGTSFATPIQAGEWALIEQQVSNATGLSKNMGDVNPLLFLAHDAVQLTQINPYMPMTSQPVPTAFVSAGAENYFDSYLLSLGYTYPVDKNFPAWYATMNNPQGPGWNYLQGLGLTYNVSLLSQIISQLALPQFRVVLSNNNSFTTLTGGNTYNLKVEYANGTAISGHVSIVAYSGDTYNNSGTMFINGQTTNLVALSGGAFTYTPQYTPNSFNAPEYAYFIVNDTTFIIYQVTPPYPTSGTLQLGIDTPYGLVTSGSAQVPMFAMVDAEGFYQLGAQGVVLLNGQPVSDAIVTEVAVQVNYSIEDPTFPSQYYGPGVTAGQFITDGRGNFFAWTNSFIAENNGPIPTQIFEVYAQYGALKSQPIFLYVEPQNGIFYTSLNNNYQENRLIGAVAFTSMRYITNITVYTNDGQKVTETFPSGSFSSQSGNASGIFQGVVPVNFTLPQAGTPSVVNILATGQNNESFNICFSGFCFVLPRVSSPITWQFSVIIPNPGPQPAASVSVPQGVQGGDVKLSWQGSWVLNTATAQLQLISQSGTTMTLATSLSGSLTFNTATVPDGVYSVQLTVTTPTGLTATASEPLIIANTLLNDLKSLQGQVNQLSGLVTTLDSEVNTLNQQISSLESQNNQLKTSNQQLQSSLSNATSLYNLAEQEISSLKSQISSLLSNNQQLQGQITSLNSQVASLQAQLSSDNATITQANALISQNAQTISAQHNQIDTLIGGILAIIVVAGALVAYFARRK